MNDGNIPYIISDGSSITVLPTTSGAYQSAWKCQVISQKQITEARKKQKAKQAYF